MLAHMVNVGIIGGLDRVGINGDWLGCHVVCLDLGFNGVCWNVDCIVMCSDVVTKYIEIHMFLPYSYIYLVTTLYFLCVQVCADNCASCDSPGECTTCDIGYVVNTGNKKCDGQFILCPFHLTTPVLG